MKCQPSIVIDHRLSLSCQNRITGRYLQVTVSCNECQDIKKCKIIDPIAAVAVAREKARDRAYVKASRASKKEGK